jgi:glutaredoxin 3
MTTVRIYTRQGCAYSAAARRLLSEKGIAFDDVDVTSHPERRAEMIERSGGRETFPQVFFGDLHVGGYEELAERDRRRGLQELLREAGQGASA